jgi:uncharacterized protein YfcZ (UPF0381/DUF406 family)
MTSAPSLTTRAIRRELTRLAPLIEEASAQFDRAYDVGDVHHIARCRLQLEHVEAQRRELELALEQLRQLASTRSSGAWVHTPRQLRDAAQKARRGTP